MKAFWINLIGVEKIMVIAALVMVSLIAVNELKYLLTN